MRRALVWVMGLVLVAVAAAPAGADEARAERVVIVSYPRLTWATVLEVRPPELLAFVDRAATASLAVRTASAETGLGDGYATISAGNRAAADEVASPSEGSGVHPGFEAVAADADDALFGAEPGALASALGDAGRSMAVIGNADVAGRADGVVPHRDVALVGVDRAGRLAPGRTDVGLALEDPSAPGGRAIDVDAYVDALDAAWDEAAVIVVEVSDLERIEQAEAADDPGAALARGDAILADVVRRAGPDDVVVVIAPAAPDDGRALTAFAVAGGGLAPGGRATSATTRRSGYVTLPDVGVTVLDALDVEVPDSMNGTAITADGGAPNDAAALRALVDDDERARFRDRAVGPVSVVFTVAQVVLYLLALRWLQRRPDRPLPPWVPLAGLAITAIPLVGFVSGLVRYRALGLVGYTVAVVAIAVAVALAVRPLRRWHPLAPPLVLVGATLALLVADVATGAHLQLDTVFGYSPTVAGRFSGFGNLAYALVGASAVVLASGQAAALGPPDADPMLPVRDRRLAIAVAVLAVAVVAVALPWLGADVGGTLALVPAAAVVVAVLGRWRISAARVLAVLAATVIVVAACAALDLARAPEDRTHLGRFAAAILDGDAGLMLRRKLAANWAILTSSVWTALVPLVVAGMVLMARPGRPLHRLGRRVVGVEAGLGGAAVVALVGFALNDSGVAIPAMMLGIVVPWLLWLLALPAPVPADPADVGQPS